MLGLSITKKLEPGVPKRYSYRNKKKEENTTKKTIYTHTQIHDTHAGLSGEHLLRWTIFYTRGGDVVGVGGCRATEAYASILLNLPVDFMK